MSQRSDIAFEVEDGLTLRGWLYQPAGPGPHPAISMAHGYAGTRHHGLDRFARRFVEAGFVVLVHDHRNFGDSDGPERGDVDPWRQIADWRRALSCLEALPQVDARRIGLWGTSYAGGHALVLGATDRRVRAVVSQVPTISGFEQGRRRVSPDATATLEATFRQDDRARFSGQAAERLMVVSSDPAVAAAYRSLEAAAFYLQDLPEGAWENSVTLRSARAARLYEPGVFVSRVSPTPLLMIVAMNDTITLTDLALAAYEQALQPKALATTPGDHFAPYGAEFDLAASSAVDWFCKHLS